MGEKVLEPETCVQILPLTRSTLVTLISLSTTSFMRVLNGDKNYLFLWRVLWGIK